MMKNVRLVGVCSVLAFVMVLVLSSAAFAHPPSAVNLSFDTETSMLTVTVLHSVGDPTDHFIDDVVVYLNGELIIEQVIFTQSASGEQVVKYVIIDANPGDTLKVWAQCNKFGDITGSIVVE